MGPFCFRPRFDSVFVNLKACGVFSGIGDDEPFLLEFGNQSIDRFFYIFAAALVPIHCFFNDPTHCCPACNETPDSRAGLIQAVVIATIKLDYYDFIIDGLVDDPGCIDPKTHG